MFALNDVQYKDVAKRYSEKIALPNNKAIVVGLVEHSQRINEAPLKPWVLCYSTGMVVTAHCNRKAGLGEACSHVGAIQILYAVETLVRSAENRSKTDFPCQWNHPSTSTIERFVPLAEMNFAKTERINRTTDSLQEFSKEEIFDWLKENKEKANTIAPLTLVTPGLNAEFIKQRTERKKQNVLMSPEMDVVCAGDSVSTTDYDNIIQLSLINTLYKSDFKGKGLEELLEIAKSIVVKIPEKYIKMIETLTVSQKESWLWEKHRVGRVTGSVFKSVCRTNVKKPAKSTVMKICYPERTRVTSKQMKYGNDMEPIARKMFIESMQKSHTNFSCVETGLVIDTLCNFFAASPDGTCMCDCCGKYLVEIKCPFSMASPTSTIQDILNLKDPYISLENNSYKLNQNHSYYYQMQIQMAVCKFQFSYFNVWSPKVQIRLKVPFDSAFWQENSVKAFRFAKTVIVPESMNSFYTKTYD
ncbi:hypothetical protein HA402_014448 [Bradysia odoriphaga]|nr:hypothetical protein HA402_014448 [Bradysia odoriphaga]